MPQRLIDSMTLLLIAVAIVAGGMGGATVAGIHQLRGRRMHATFVLAYVIVGSALGMTLYYFGSYLGIQTTSPDDLIGKAFLFSIVGTLILASKDLGLRWTLERFGWRMTVTVYQDERKKPRGEEGGCNG